jgi:hypothetical protein
MVAMVWLSGQERPQTALWLRAIPEGETGAESPASRGGFGSDRLGGWSERVRVVPRVPESRSKEVIGRWVRGFALLP